MSISNEEAMRDLQEAKQRSNEGQDNYRFGIFMGAAGAYFLAGLITYAQYKQIAFDEHTRADDITESAAEYFTSDELFAAYKAADLRRLKVSYQTAITTPLLRQALEAQARATRKEQQLDNPSPTGGERTGRDSWQKKPYSSA